MRKFLLLLFLWPTLSKAQDRSWAKYDAKRAADCNLILAQTIHLDSWIPATVETRDINDSIVDYWIPVHVSNGRVDSINVSSINPYRKYLTLKDTSMPITGGYIITERNHDTITLWTRIDIYGGGNPAPQNCFIQMLFDCSGYNPLFSDNE